MVVMEGINIMNLNIKLGWYTLLIAVVGEMLIPLIIAPYYKGYNHTTMAISTLGNSNSPVRLSFNLWMLIAGVLFLIANPAIYNAYYQVSKPLATISVLFITIFAVGACILTCFFSVNETKDVVTTASKIHGVSSAIGFMLFLFVPLLLTILSLKSNDKTTGIICAISFVLALLFFVLFIMSDKPELQRTFIAKEGLWQRMNLFFMYLPLGYIAIRNILGLER